MRARRSWSLLLLGLLGMLLIFAFAASNTVPDSKAGDGEGNIIGYTVSNIRYSLDNADPSKIASVSFDLDTAANEVHAAIWDNSQWHWASCTNTGGNSWTCSFPSLPAVLPALKLRVVAAQ